MPKTGVIAKIVAEESSHDLKQEHNLGNRPMVSLSGRVLSVAVRAKPESTPARQGKVKHCFG